MLPDIKRLFDNLTHSAQLVASHVYHSVSTGQITPEEMRSSLALSAGLREVVDSGDVARFFHDALATGELHSLIQLLGFSDARCRKAFASWLSKHYEFTGMLAGAISIRSISHSRRINGIFRAAIAYAEKI